MTKGRIYCYRNHSDIPFKDPVPIRFENEANLFFFIFVKAKSCTLFVVFIG